MQWRRTFWVGFITLFLYSLPVFAWQVTWHPASKDQLAKVVASSDRDLKGVLVYLVWFDRDAKDNEDAFVSWTADKKWQKGLSPITATPLDIKTTDEVSVEFDKSCPTDHRCFMALVATVPNPDPLDVGQWRAQSLLPLSAAAGRDRLPGQVFFLPNDGSDRGYTTADGVAAENTSAAEDKTETPSPAAPATTTDEGIAAGSATTTEKPDIFKLIGDKLVYANGQAQRFQVINIADPTRIFLEGWTTLAGSPRELYVLGQYYVLLQTDYTNNGQDGTHITVLSEGTDGKFTTVQDMTLPGWFIESRRRGDIIYTVAQDATPIPYVMDCMDCMWGGVSHINIAALRLGTDGQLQQVDKAQMLGYSPAIAIFQDNLVIASHDPVQWPATQVQVFDLAQTDDVLVELPVLQVPGQVPSEFHLSVLNQKLRVVYGPADRKDGSTLAVYDLTLPKMDLVGQVDKIAPGEDLFATRFTDDRAFVVTYERKDPLWVIDLADPTQPKILGELKVPGWSEKLFFHDDLLFAVGIDDQPTENDISQWVRRVAVSLFNVAEPTNPTLINRFTPLVNKVTYSWSPALDDERALLLDWDNSFAALPLEFWESEGGSSLQIVSFTDKQLSDAGRLDTPVPVQRSVVIADDKLAALGDQAVFTLQWGNGKAELLSEVELATNLVWLKQYNGSLWGSAMGNSGYSRFYQYNPATIETPTQRWSLPRNYDGLQLADGWAVFYDYNPLAVQVLDLATGQLRMAQVLEKMSTSSTGEAVMPIWYDRTSPLVSKGWFYVAEQRPLQTVSSVDTTTSSETTDTKAGVALPFVPTPDSYLTQWLLRSWNLQTETPQEGLSRSIPGRPLTFTATGELVTQETTDKQQTRLNLLALEADAARLVASRELECRSYSQVLWAETALYVKCETEDRFYPGPILYDAAVRDGESTQDFTTTLLKLDPAQGFAEVGKWTLKGQRNVRAVAPEVVMMEPQWWYYGPWLAEGGMVKEDPPASTDTNGCDIYQLTAGVEPVLLKHLDTCPYSGVDGLVLTATQAWSADGFAGISVIDW